MFEGYLMNLYNDSFEQFPCGMLDDHYMFIHFPYSVLVLSDQLSAKQPWQPWSFTESVTVSKSRSTAGVSPSGSVEVVWPCERSKARKQESKTHKQTNNRKQSTNQPTNLPTNQPTNQSINQSSISVKQSVKQAHEHTINDIKSF
jgi:hypothetical protein